MLRSQMTTSCEPTIDLGAYSSSHICQRCGASNRQYARYCRSCGAATTSEGGLLLGARTLQGRHAENQDKGLLRTVRGPRGTTFLLGIVADGVGGGPAGAYASRRAVAVAHSQLVQALYGDEPTTPEGWRELVAQAVRVANTQLHDEAYQHQHLAGMGTTLSVALIVGDTIHIGHVGDSRVYRISADGQLHCLTTDHTVGERLESLYGADHEIVLANRHLLYYVVGQWPTVDVQSVSAPFAAGDRMLLCTDGLTRALKDPSIANVVLSAASAQQACDTLVTLAKQCCDDDITVLLAGALRQKALGA